MHVMFNFNIVQMINLITNMKPTDFGYIKITNGSRRNTMNTLLIAVILITNAVK